MFDDLQVITTAAEKRDTEEERDKGTYTGKGRGMDNQTSAEVEGRNNRVGSGSKRCRAGGRLP